jgi:hypothetical protein
MSTKFSGEDRERILRECRETIERTDAMIAGWEPRLTDIGHSSEDPLAEALRRPRRTRNQQDRYELEMQEERFARQHAESEVQTVGAKMTALEHRIAALEHGRFEDCADMERLWTIVGEVIEGTKQIGERFSDAIDDLRSVVNQPAKAANDHMEALFARLEENLDRIAPRRAPDNDSTVIDLPPLPRVN